MLKFSLRNAFRKKTTATLAALGVGFGLMLVFVLGAFSAGVNAQFEDQLNQSIGQVSITEKLESGADSRLPKGIEEDIIDTKGIGEHVKRYNVETQAPDYFTDDYTGKMDGSEGDELILVGLEQDLDEEYGGPTTKITKGDVFDDGKQEVILDSRLVDKAEFDVDIGDEITIELDKGGLSSTKFEIVGIYEQEDNGAPDFVPRDYYIYTSVDIIWDLLQEEGNETNHYTRIILLFDAKTVDETNDFADTINENSEDGEYSPTFVSAVSLAAFAESIQEAFETLNVFTSIIGFITAIAGGMAIIVTQMMSVSARMQEFAILKSTGWKNSHIFKNVIYESIFLGLIGAAFAFALGGGLIFLLSSGASPFGASSVLITWEVITQVFAYALGLGILGGLYPAWKAARVRPVMVLKGG